MKFNIGDKVLTVHGDVGIVKSTFRPDVVDSGYDWWIVISFMNKGRQRSMTMPYKNKELEKISEKG